MNDKTPLRELKGVGEKAEKLFQKIGITTAEELLRYYMRSLWRLHQQRRTKQSLSVPL